MTIENIKNKWIKFVNDMNQSGVPLPMLKDPKTGQGSITITMFWASFTLCLFCAITFLATAVSHLTGIFTPGDGTQEAIKNASQYALELFLSCGGFYLGRKMQRDSKGTINVESQDNQDGK